MTFKLNSPLPDNILKLIDPEERAKLGKGFRTMQEIQSHSEEVTERKLHADIRNLLNLKGIAFLETRMDKRSHATVGWPDFSFAVLLQKPSKFDPTSVTCIPVPCGWEVKVGNRKLRPEQEEVLRRMQTEPNGWRIKIIRSLQEAADELKALGI